MALVLLDQLGAFASLCVATHQWGVFVSWPADAWPDEEILKACPWLAGNERFVQHLIDGMAIALCDGPIEAASLFHRTVGEDGPTTENPYTGPARVFAVTCDPNGELMHVNT